MLAVSTAWNSSRYDDVRRMLEDFRAWGISALELSYRLSSYQLDLLSEIIYESGFSVVSVHNFCPLPRPEVKKRYYCDYYRISSLNEQERKQAVFLTRQTIDTAVKFKSPLVVVHAGMVELKAGYGRHLVNLFREGKVFSEEYRKSLNSFLSAREKAKQPFLEAAEKSLNEILDYAFDRGIKIGLENRYYPAEIPSLTEAEDILPRYNSRGLVYWHDSGHAAANERLLFCPADAFLEKLGRYCAGFHIHDLKGIDDHMAPFSGDDDFSFLKPYFKKNIPLVIEAHSKAAPEEMKTAVARLKEMID